MILQNHDENGGWDWEITVAKGVIKENQNATEGNNMKTKVFGSKSITKSLNRTHK